MHCSFLSEWVPRLAVAMIAILCAKAKLCKQQTLCLAVASGYSTECRIITSSKASALKPGHSQNGTHQMHRPKHQLPLPLNSSRPQKCPRERNISLLFHLGPDLLTSGNIAQAAVVHPL
ncbi:hypothetical protein BDQ17DRAFT_1324437 [Cyathus striatus]|nr:hypothetical protein BDQ17DRAFT_1324437 [Cyathus striatus]